MNLIEASWIPVRRKSGKQELIAPWKITDGLETDPIVALNAPRPDFNGALIQFLIGLVQTASAPKDKYQWADWNDTPPAADELRQRFSKIANVFNLTGTGALFMQDFEPLNGEAKPINALLIEAPGGITLKNNGDHFVKRNAVEGLCFSCTAAALFTLQTNAPSGGRGHRVSLRGGGPLTTLVMGDNIWQTILINVLPRDAFTRLTSNPAKKADADIFPWLAAAHTSEKGEITTPNDAHPAQMFWGMPRRIRLNFEHVRAGECDVCGAHTDSLIMQYVTKKYGVRYSGWEHTLTPYTRDAKGFASPRHGRSGCVTYRHWLGLVQQGGKEDFRREPARVVHEFVHERYWDLRRTVLLRLWAFGFETDNMKVVCWHDSMMPLYLAQKELQQDFEKGIAGLIEAAVRVAANLKRYIKNALYGHVKDITERGLVKWEIRNEAAKKDKALFDNLSDGFWQATEQHFMKAIKDLKQSLESGGNREAERRDWHKVICNQALKQFDEIAYSGSFEDGDPQRITFARNELIRWNNDRKIKNDILGLPRDRED